MFNSFLKMLMRSNKNVALLCIITFLLKIRLFWHPYSPLCFEWLKDHMGGGVHNGPLKFLHLRQLRRGFVKFWACTKKIWSILWYIFKKWEICYGLLKRCLKMQYLSQFLSNLSKTQVQSEFSFFAKLPLKKN